MRIAIDTNRYSDQCRGEPKAVEIFRTAEHIYVPFVTLGELRGGFLCGTKSEENERVLLKFLGEPRVDVLHTDDQTTYHYARLFHHLRKQGKMIPTNDLWIAALCLQHNLVLCARDAHFDHLPQLARI